MLTLPTLTRGNVETVGVQWGRTDKQAVSHRLPTDSPPWVWGGYCLWRGRGWEGPDTLGCRIRSTLGVGGLGEPADPTRQNPKKASILASEPPDVLEEESGPAGRRESCPGTPSRGPEKRGGGGGLGCPPRRSGPGLRKGRVDGEGGNAQPLKSPGLAPYCWAAREWGGCGIGQTQAPGERRAGGGNCVQSWPAGHPASGGGTGQPSLDAPWGARQGGRGGTPVEHSTPERISRGV